MLRWSRSGRLWKPISDYDRGDEDHNRKDDPYLASLSLWDVPFTSSRSFVI